MTTPFRESIRRRGREIVPFHEHDGSDISGEIVASVIKVIQLLGGTITGEEIILAGGVDGILRSDNFVAGSAGWRALGDGTFEAQDGIFRGTLNADDMIAGTLVVARIGAKTLAVEHLVVGDFDNIIQNPGWELGINGPHVIDSHGGATGWLIATANERSGTFCLQFDSASQTGRAGYLLNAGSSSGEINHHIQATEGEQFTFSIWVAPITAAWNEVKVVLSWRDASNSEISSTAITASGLTQNTYVQQTVSGTAPAGSVALMPIIIVENSGNTGIFVFDDCISRRKVGTLIIEDQAVDVERLLVPVYTEVVDAGDNNVSITTTIAEKLTTNLTIPSWVGSVDITNHCRLQVTDTGNKNFRVRADIGGTSGSDTDHGVNNNTQTVNVAGARTVTSPGSTIAVAIDISNSSGTNSTNEIDVVGTALGIR